MEEELTKQMSLLLVKFEEVAPDLIASQQLTNAMGLAFCIPALVGLAFLARKLSRWEAKDPVEKYVGLALLSVAAFALWVCLVHDLPAFIYPEAEVVSNLLK